MIKRYRINWSYRSSLGGPWLKGQVVELDEQIAAAINRDSPGVVAEVKAEDRQVKQAPQKRG